MRALKMDDMEEIMMGLTNIKMVSSARSNDTKCATKMSSTCEKQEKRNLFVSLVRVLSKKQTDSGIKRRGTEFAASHSHVVVFYF
jgi:hypothetical protein